MSTVVPSRSPLPIPFQNTLTQLESAFRITLDYLVLLGSKTDLLVILRELTQLSLHSLYPFLRSLLFVPSPPSLHSRSAFAFSTPPNSHWWIFSVALVTAMSPCFARNRWTPSRRTSSRFQLSFSPWSHAEPRLAHPAVLPLRSLHSSQARHADPRLCRSLQHRTPRSLAPPQLLDALQTHTTDRKQPFSADVRHKLSFFPCLIAFYLCLCFLLYELRLGLWTRVELPAMLWSASQSAVTRRFLSSLVAQFREYETRYSIRLCLFSLTNSPFGHQTTSIQTIQTFQTIQTIQTIQTGEGRKGSRSHTDAHRRLDTASSLSSRSSLRFLLFLPSLS